MIRAFVRSAKIMVVGISLTTILIGMTIIGGVLVLAYCVRMALWPEKKDLTTILLERLFQKVDQ